MAGFEHRRLQSGQLWWLLCGVLAACSSAPKSEAPGQSGSGGAAPLGGNSAVTGGSTAGGGAATGGAGAGGNGGSAGRGGSPGDAGAAGVFGQGGAGGTSSGGAAGSGASAGMGGSGDACTTTRPVTFTKNIRINDDTGNGNQAEVTLATGPKGLAVAAWGDSRGERTCAFSVSKDGGVTWGKNVAIANNGGMFVGDPAATIDGGGVIYAVCQQYADNGQIRMMTSSDAGDTWSQVRSIQAAPDKPWAGGGSARGTVFVSWLGTSAGIKRSIDSGQTFGPIQSLGDIIHGTAIVTSTTGLVHVPYNLDSDRNQLRYLRSVNGGDSWEMPRDILADMGKFCFDCNPRQHPIVGAASDPSGKFVAITWSSTMKGGEGDDDVWLMYSKDGGKTWTQPLRVNDNQTPSRQFQPWVAVDSCGRVHVAWTDLRNGQNEVFYARSVDPSKGFEPNLQVTDGRGSANTDFLGDYKGVAITGSDVLIVWQDTRRDSGDIYASRAVGAAAP